MPSVRTNGSTFVDAAGRAAAVEHLRAAAEFRRNDPNVSGAERDRVERLVGRTLAA